MSPWPRVGVVILNYNGREYLERFLPQVLASTYPNLQIYVADNDSIDDSLAFVRRQYPDITCMELGDNHGFARGYNLALQKIDTPYYVLLNSDVEVSPGWMEPIIDLMENNPTVGACQPKINAYHQKDSFEYAGAAGGWIDALGYPFCRGRIFDITEPDRGQYDETQEIFWASGAALFIRSQLFHHIGGFDEDYFAHSEEIDLCWRLKTAGFKVVACTDSVVFHVGGGTLTYHSPRKAYFNFRNSLYTLLKNESAAKLCWLLPLRFLLDGLAGLLFLFQGKTAHIRSIIRAHWTFLPNFRKMIRKRRRYREMIQKVSISQQPNREGVYNGSIVWQYYLRRKRFFRELWD